MQRRDYAGRDKWWRSDIDIVRLVCVDARWTSFKALLLEKPSAKEALSPILFPLLSLNGMFSHVFTVPHLIGNH